MGNGGGSGSLFSVTREPELPALGPPPGYLPTGWPVTMVFYGYLFFWAMGVSNFIWIIVAVPMLITLMKMERARLPSGAGMWMLFLGWTLLSVFAVGIDSRAVVWGYRFSVYLAAGIVMVYVYNLPRREFPVSKAVRAMGTYWLFIVGSGFLSLVMPDLEFQSPIQAILPGSLGQNPFVMEMTQARLAQVHDFLGFEVTRPAGPFTYTNNWGSNIALLAPMIVVWSSTLSGWRRNALLGVAVASILPVIQSLNRGLWISVGIGMVYAAIRYAFNRRIRPLVLLIAFFIVVVVVAIVTPLGSLVTQRIDEGHSDTRRLSLYEQSIDAALESPLIGHGGPIPDAEDPEGPPVGTHGQIWLLLVSYGFPAATIFVGFLAYLLLRTRLARRENYVFWVHVMIAIAVVQMPFYFMIPSQLPVLMVASGLALREVDAVYQDQ